MQFRVTVRNGRGELITNLVEAPNKQVAVEVNFTDLVLNPRKVSPETCGGPYTVLHVETIQ